MIKTNSYGLHLTSVVLSAFVAALLTASSAMEVRAQNLFIERFDAIGVNEVDIDRPDALQKGAQADQPLALTIRALGKHWNLRLRPANILSDKCIAIDNRSGSRVESPCKNYVYWGTVGGGKNTFARVAIFDGEIDARIEDNGRVYRVMSEHRVFPKGRADKLVVFDEEDERVPDSLVGGCTVSDTAADMGFETDSADTLLQKPRVSNGQRMIYENDEVYFPVVEAHIVADDLYLSPQHFDNDCQFGICGGGSLLEIQAMFADNHLIFMNRANVIMRLQGWTLGLSGTGISSSENNFGGLENLEGHSGTQTGVLLALSRYCSCAQCQRVGRKDLIRRDLHTVSVEIPYEFTIVHFELPAEIQRQFSSARIELRPSAPA